MIYIEYFSEKKNPHSYGIHGPYMDDLPIYIYIYMHTYYINPLNMVMDCSSVCWITRGYKDSMDIYTVYI